MQFLILRYVNKTTKASNLLARFRRPARHVLSEFRRTIINDMTASRPQVAVTGIALPEAVAVH